MKLAKEQKRLTKLTPDSECDVCPQCHRSKLRMTEGETRRCPICGNTWTRKEAKHG